MAVLRVWSKGSGPARMTHEWQNRWTIPIFVVMFLVGSLLVFAGGSALAPFIYSTN